MTRSERARRHGERFLACERRRPRPEDSGEDSVRWLTERVPLLECPDETVEEIYYFRWWVFRKHLLETPEGTVVTEFLPNVPWAGAYNTINAAAGFHLREARWLRDGGALGRQLIRFWLTGSGDRHSYSSWFPAAVEEWCRITGDYPYALSLLEEMEADRLWWERARTGCGLYRSVDDRDAMEDSISGSGLRPTMNAYLLASSASLARFSQMAGRTQAAQRHASDAAALRDALELLWDGDFYRVIPDACIPAAEAGTFTFSQVPPAQYVREELGYIPWYFGIPGPEKAVAFRQLLTEEGFRAPYGITTAERRHPRFGYAVDHECLWNGPVWPFATGQTLTGAARLLRGPAQCEFSREDWFRLFRQYAQSQYLETAEGRVPWIDEDMDPFTGRWLARDILLQMGFPEELGGYERGRDYNHSLFCDLTLSGLLGLEEENGVLTAHPLCPETWDWYRVEGVPFRGREYTVCYDRDGSHYGRGAGLWIRECEA